MKENNLNKVYNVRDIPLKELTMRRYEKPHVELSPRDLVRKLCLSLGLLQPGDKRDVIVDILYVLTFSNQPLSLSEIQQLVQNTRKEFGLDNKGTSLSNLRTQIRRLKDLFFISKVGGAFYINENLSLEEILTTKIKPFLLDPIFSRLKDYAIAIDLLKNQEKSAFEISSEADFSSKNV